ncbi:MAG: protein kinase [Nitrospiraceae bacterium]
MAKTAEKIGRYEIRDTLGKGATGIVYRGWDTRLELDVAIKVLLIDSDDANHSEEIGRFLREVKISRTLKHPNIVSVYDVDDDPTTGRPYIVMEFIHGKPLGTILKERSLSIPETVKLFQQLASGLDYSGQEGVVHRDVKPANILVAPDSLVPKLVDFGVARTEGTNTTHSGKVVGTPHYMSPEQWYGELVDGRSDLFSLGAILYEVLTQQKAFPGDSFAAVKTAALDPNTPVPPGILKPELPHELIAVVMRALAKNPAQRYQRGKELCDALQAITEPRKPKKLPRPKDFVPLVNSVFKLATPPPPNGEPTQPADSTGSDNAVSSPGPLLPPAVWKQLRLAAAGLGVVGLLLIGLIIWPSIKSLLFSPITVQVGVIRDMGRGKMTLLNEGDLLLPTDKLAVYINPDTDMFTYIWQVDSSGKFARIFPNPDITAQENPVPSGTPLWVPHNENQERGWFHLNRSTAVEEIMIATAPTPLHQIHDPLGMLGVLGLGKEQNEDSVLADPRDTLKDMIPGRDTGTFSPPDGSERPPIRYLEGDPNGFYYGIRFERL